MHGFERQRGLRGVHLEEKLQESIVVLLGA